MLVYRCFAWDRRARIDRPDGPLWVPREFQGEGRHDNPQDYGCLYVADRAVSAVVEQLARFRGQRLVPQMLLRRGLPLAVAAIEVPDNARVIDLDDPRVLDANSLRPSQVATRTREVTQPQALTLFRRHKSALALRWWSTYEALWANFTLFDRALSQTRVVETRQLAADDETVATAAELLGIAP